MLVAPPSDSAYSVFQRLSIAVTLLYVATVWTLAALTAEACRFSLGVYLPVIAGATWMCLLVVLVWLLLRTLFVERPERPFHFLAERASRQWFPPARLRQAIVEFVLVALTMSAYTSFKSLIPHWTTYSWDPLWIRIDRQLHWGVEPWRITHSLFGNATTTWIADLFYRSWFLVMMGAVFWQAISLPRNERRGRFFLAFYLCWIINGTILAFHFASVGPCFCGDAGIADGRMFDPLMNRLSAINDQHALWSLTSQTMLMSYYHEHTLAPGSGISAMPSMHVSIAMLLFLLGWRSSTPWRWISFLFLMATVIASVHLAWHYAVDGYLAIGTTAMIWMVTSPSFWRAARGKFALRHPSRM